MAIENLEILTSAEAAEYLRLSRSTLAKMRLSGGGPVFTKLGRRVVYEMGDLEAWVLANKHSSTSEYPSYS